MEVVWQMVGNKIILRANYVLVKILVGTVTLHIIFSKEFVLEFMQSRGSNHLWFICFKYVHVQYFILPVLIRGPKI